jgi:hypothetical protein
MRPSVNIHLNTKARPQKEKETKQNTMRPSVNIHLNTKARPQKDKEKQNTMKPKSRRVKKQATQPQVSQKQKKRISFGDIELREYAIELGDNPSTIGK